MPGKSTTEPKPASKTSKTKKKKLPAAHNEIAEMAYFIWQEKGGSEVENWLEAERCLSGKSKKEE